MAYGYIISSNFPVTWTRKQGLYCPGLQQWYAISSCSSVSHELLKLSLVCQLPKQFAGSSVAQAGFCKDSLWTVLRLVTTIHQAITGLKLYYITPHKQCYTFEPCSNGPRWSFVKCSQCSESDMGWLGGDKLNNLMKKKALVKLRKAVKTPWIGDVV